MSSTHTHSHTLEELCVGIFRRCDGVSALLLCRCCCSLGRSLDAARFAQSVGSVFVACAPPSDFRQFTIFSLNARVSADGTHTHTLARAPVHAHAPTHTRAHTTRRGRRSAPRVRDAQKRRRACVCQALLVHRSCIRGHDGAQCLFC